MPEKTIWTENGKVFIIDQTVLPGDRRVSEITSVGEMWDAIKRLRVRGAPAIGIAAAFGVWLAIEDVRPQDSLPLEKSIENACNYLATSRPTAVNLFWALDRVKRLSHLTRDLEHPLRKQAIWVEANRMLEEDNEACLAIGKHGAALLQDGNCVLTHCNAGGLATAQYGTALAPICYAVERENKKIEVYADETRPLLQGSRLTAWELMQANIPVTVICDNMAGTVMRQGRIDTVIVGTDRVARNGDFANKIGTYGVAVLAHEHKLPFYVAAPLSSIDMNIPNGDAIPIEERGRDEVAYMQGAQLAPDGVKVYNPAFDVTPHQYVSGFITEKGIVRPPFVENLAKLFS